MAAQETTVKPAIKIYVNEALRQSNVLQEAISGVEEESIPYEILRAAEGDARELAHRGARESVLEVGIGISERELVVHYKKLPEEKPLFTVNHAVDEGKVRSICSNAARLVKGTPFII